MTQAMSGRPAKTEYAASYEPYVGWVPEGPIVALLRGQLDEVVSFLDGLDGAVADRRYAPGKWSVREVVGHVIDVERVFAYRALCFGRGDGGPLPGFDQDDYVRAAEFSRRSLESLVREFALVRRANLEMFAGFDDEIWLRGGTANDAYVSVRAIAYILAGHAAHHVTLLRERYL